MAKKFLRCQPNKQEQTTQFFAGRFEWLCIVLQFDLNHDASADLLQIVVSHIQLCVKWHLLLTIHIMQRPITNFVSNNFCQETEFALNHTNSLALVVTDSKDQSKYLVYTYLRIKKTNN